MSGLVAASFVNPATFAGASAGVLVGLGILGLLVVVVAASRNDPDASGRRPYSVYLFAVAFVTIFAVLAASTLIVHGLVQLVGTNFGGGQSLHPVGDAAARQSVLTGLVALVAGAVWLLHFRGGFRMADRPPLTDRPAGRVAVTYICAVCFVSALVIIVAAVILAYAVFQLIAPGVFQLGGGRVHAVRNLLVALYLGLAAGGLLIYHLRLGPDAFRRVLRPRSTAPSVPVSPEAPRYQPTGYPIR